MVWQVKMIEKARRPSTHEQQKAFHQHFMSSWNLISLFTWAHSGVPINPKPRSYFVPPPIIRFKKVFRKRIHNFSKIYSISY